MTVNGESEHEAFGRALEDLKRSGAAILVIGDVPPDGAHTTACCQLLGDSSQRRRRMLTLPIDGPASIDERLEADARRDRSHLRVIETDFGRSTTTRSAVASQPGSHDSFEPDEMDVMQVTGDVGELGLSIAEAINSLEAASESSEESSGEVRVCVESMKCLVDTVDDVHDTTMFVHLLAGRIRRAAGLGHFHLRVPLDSPIREQLEWMFDMVIELRLENGRTEQRWTIFDGPSSGWIPLAETGEPP